MGQNLLLLALDQSLKNNFLLLFFRRNGVEFKAKYRVLNIFLELFLLSQEPM